MSRRAKHKGGPHREQLRPRRAAGAAGRSRPSRSKRTKNNSKPGRPSPGCSEPADFSVPRRFCPPGAFVPKLAAVVNFQDVDFGMGIRTARGLIAGRIKAFPRGFRKRPESGRRPYRCFLSVCYGKAVTSPPPHRPRRPGSACRSIGRTPGHVFSSFFAWRSASYRGRAASRR